MSAYFRNKAWIVYLPVILTPFLLFGIPLLYGKVLYWGTPALQFVPWREYACQQLENGTLPLWNPLNGMGAPLIANYQLALFYPPGWLTILGHWLAGAPGVAWMYTLLVPIHLAWAGIGMVVLMRSIGIGRLGQIITGLATALSCFLIARAGFFSMVWTGAWLPWVLWSASGIASPFMDVIDRKRFLWLALITAMMLLAGQAQLSWYILLFAGLWVLFGSLIKRGWKGALKSTTLFAGLGLSAVLMAGIQLAPTFEYLLQSQRAASYSYDPAMVYSFWPWRFLTFISPELFGNPGLGDYWGYAAYWEDAVYIGIIPLFLALRTLPMLLPSHHEKGKAGVAFLWSMALIGCLLALGANTPIFPWLFRRIPTFGYFQAPARWMIWTDASLLLLAGISTRTWSCPEGKRRRNLNLATAGFFAVAIGAGIASLLLPDLKPGLLRGFLIFALLGFSAGILALTTPQPVGKRRLWWAPAVVVILSIDLLGANLFSNSFIQSRFYQPELVDAGKIDTMVTDGRIFISVEDEYQLKFDKYLKFNDTRLTSEFTDIRQTILPNLNLLNGIASANNFDPLTPARFDKWMAKINEVDEAVRGKLLGEMGVTAVIKPDQTGRRVTFLPVESKKIVEGYTCARPVPDAKTAIDKAFIDIQEGASGRCIIVESDSVENVEGNAGNFQISAVNESYNALKFRVDSEKSIWMRIAITWYPGWHAKVDGKHIQVYAADYIFTGFQVPAGMHEVEFSYQPTSFIIGVGMTVLGLIIAILIGLFIFRRTKQDL